MTLRLTEKLRDEIDRAGLRKALRRNRSSSGTGSGADGRGRRQTRLRCAGGNVAAAGTRDRDQSARNLRQVRFRIQHQLSQPTRPRPLREAELAQADQIRQRKTVSTAVDVLEGLAAEHEVPRMVLDYRQLSKLKSTYVDALPALLNSCTRRLHTTFNMAGSATGRLSSVNPNLQNIPIRTELGREIRAAFVAEAGHVLLSADYSQIELRLLAHFSGDQLLLRPSARAKTFTPSTASQVFGVPPLMVNAGTSAARQGGEFRHRLRVVGVRTVAADRHRYQRGQALHRRLLREVQGVREFIDQTWSRPGAIRKSLPCSGGCVPFPTSTARISTCAALQSAPR